MATTATNSNPRVQVHVQILHQLPHRMNTSNNSNKLERRRRKRSYKYDEHATIYVYKEDAAQLETTTPGLSDGSVCLLSSKNCGVSLVAPVILRNLPGSNAKDRLNGGESNDDGATKDASSTNHPQVYVPPCIAATLGMHSFHTQRYLTAFMQRIDDNHQHEKQQHQRTAVVEEATHVTLREIGLLPPLPSIKLPGVHNSNNSDATNKETDEGSINHSKPQVLDSDEDEGERELRKYFMYPPKESNSHDKTRSKPPKPRQRLLSLGSIIATPSSSSSSLTNGDIIRNVRMYQVVDIQSANDEEAHAQSSGQQFKAYHVSPLTRMTLLPPSSNGGDGKQSPLHPQLDSVQMIPGHEWRLPRPSLLVSFLQSVRNAMLCSNNISDNSQLATRQPEHQSNSSTIRHPSAKEVIDALYLQGVVSSVNTKQCPMCDRGTISSPGATSYHSRIVHVVGGEDNHVRGCVAEAADVSEYNCILLHSFVYQH